MQILNKLERKTPTSVKIVIALIVIMTSLLIGLSLSSEKTDIHAATVSITHKGGGGTGVVIYSSEHESVILTNKHVCKPAINGGTVHVYDGSSYLITGISVYEKHDLCKVKIANKLKSVAKISSSSPKFLSKAIVSGHPSLFPNVISIGHFSGKKIIDVFEGVEECTKDMLKKDDLLLMCMFFGVIPKITTFETILTTATIMPGSSGSAVYTPQNKLGALIFAGSGDFGYGFAVPFEYIVDFLAQPDNYQIPDNRRKTKTRRLFDSDSVLKKCSIYSKNDKIKDLCKVISRDLNWRKINVTTVINSDI